MSPAFQGRVKQAQIKRLRELNRPGQESPVWQHADGHFFLLDRTEMIPGKWYHTDETWSETYGPYDSKVEASAALNRYAETL